MRRLAAARLLAALALPGLLALPGCTIGRGYVGKEFTVAPAEVLHPGQTTISEVLALFGAPDRLQRRSDGEVLSYHFTRNNTSQLELQEPVITRITFFTYTKRQQKADRLTLFFDEDGVLEHYGHTHAIEELDPL